jgi:signal transduction histidine kinase
MDIARELHDVVAHHMSVITVQAGYGGLLLDDGAASPETTRARAALAVIETTGRETLEEMRRLVEVLQTEHGEPGSAHQEPGKPDEPGRAPAPGLEDLPRLIEHAAHAGVRVSTTMSGTERALPSGEGLAAYRIVQEALTNVIKHGGCDTATLRLHFSDEHVEIQVDNRAAGADLGLGLHSHRTAGRGTAGMRERAALYGGTLQAGPTSEGGYRVRARLPIPPAVEHTR